MASNTEHRDLVRAAESSFRSARDAWSAEFPDNTAAVFQADLTGPAATAWVKIGGKLYELPLVVIEAGK